MTNTATEALSVVVEREIPYPPEKIWRALTQPHLMSEPGRWVIGHLRHHGRSYGPKLRSFKLY